MEGGDNLDNENYRETMEGGDNLDNDFWVPLEKDEYIWTMTFECHWKRMNISRQRLLSAIGKGWIYLDTGTVEDSQGSNPELLS
jgi:hypothetical protein